MSHHNIEDFKPLSVSPKFGVLARPIVRAYNEDQEPRLATLSSSSAPDGEWLTGTE